MARANLRAAFMSGIGSPVTAQQVFTNRRDEMAAFELSLETLRQTLDQAWVSPVVDRAQGRQNVLVFYGVGGIGKTTLSLEIERRFTDAAAAAGRQDAACVRIDLAEDGACDIETLILRIRAGLGKLGRNWPAFDLALASYWARAHPGEALQEFLDSSSLLRRAARRVGLSEQIIGSVAQVVPSGVGALAGLAHRAALVTYRAIRDRVREGRLLTDCELFAELVEADADYETLSFFPYLLAWDLERNSSPGDRPGVCVFLDTFEVLAGRSDRTVEQLIQRCVYLMPNVLFVITGRNRVDWADLGLAGDLDFAGPDCWPGLHFSNTSEPRQHLVGYLSEADADSYLREVLTRDGEPAMSSEIRQRIVAGAQGLPLYLDLSVSHFVALLRREVIPSVEHFGGTFVAVATRSIRDLSKEERDLVRTAALVERFDRELLQAGQPTISDGRVSRFLRRPFLIRDDSYDHPFALHAALRQAIGQADQRLADGWSDLDRHTVADRLLHQLGARLSPSAGRALVAQNLDAGMRLAADYGAFADWLALAVQRLVEAGQWMLVSTAVEAGPTSTPDFNALCAAIQGIRLRRTGHAAEAVRVLQEADRDQECQAVSRHLMRLHLAHALRNHGDYTQAATIYQRLIDGEFVTAARYWLCDYEYLNGRFQSAMAALRANESPSAAQEGERLRLIGHIWRVNARFNEARHAYTHAIALARNEGFAAAEAKALANLAQTTCWSGDTASVNETARQARELLDLVPNPVELVKVRTAEAVTSAIAGDPAAAWEAIYDSRRLADDIGYRGGHNLADVAEILVGARAGDQAAVRRACRELDQRTRTSGGNTYWVPIVMAWIDGAAAAAERYPATEWLDGAVPTLRRWAEVAALP